jgi:hypothetical protein
VRFPLSFFVDSFHIACAISGHSGGSKKLVLTISFASIAAVREPAVLKSNEGQSGRLVELLKSTTLIVAPLGNKLVFLRPQILPIAESAPANKAGLGRELRN